MNNPEPMKISKETKRVLIKLNPANAPLKHGLYSELKPKRLDQRTRLAKYAKELRDDLVSSLGGDDNLSAQEKIILDDLIIPQILAIRSFVQKAMQPQFEVTENAIKYWVTLCNSSRLALCSIGLGKRAKDITPLSQRLAALAGQSEKKESHDTQG